MNNLILVTLQIVAEFFVAAILSSLLCSLLYTPFRRMIQRFAPSTRSLTTLAFAAIAPAVGWLTVLLNVLPGHAQLVVLQHCQAPIAVPVTCPGGCREPPDPGSDC